MLRQLAFKLALFFLYTCSFIYSDILGDLRICALRVSFSLDEDESTTGNGQFLNSSNGIDCSNYTIDRPPHNQSYFNSQIRAVSSYFDSVSYGNFSIDLESSMVYPLEIDSSYQLDSSMASYNPYDQSNEKDYKITKLFEDAVLLAYQKDEVNFSNYDLIIVFHAGIGQDFSLPFLDPTPQDIPSTYIDNKMIKENIEDGRLVIDGYEILHGIILPETQNHLLYEISNEMFSTAGSPCEYQYGLTGTLALMIGFAVGLPPLWNIDSGTSGVGIFGLMDQGSNNGRGIIPAPPTAWSRIYAGWEEPTVVNFNSTVSLPSRSKNQIAKININENEYFLIENRKNTIKNDLSIDSLQYIMWQNSGEDSITPYINILFDSTGLIIDSNNVIVSVPNYDIGLPKSGLLIWHIDENIIKNGLTNFTINSNASNLGIDLEEADGAQDIGFESFFQFNDPSSGYFGDLWYNGNVEYNRANPQMKGLKPKFGPDTYPNTKANTQAETFIVIENISKAKEVMSFDLRNSIKIINFPDTTISINNVFKIFQNGTNQIIIYNDSLWLSDIDSIQNKILFHIPSSEDYVTIFKKESNHTLINVFEHKNDATYHFEYKYDLLSKSVSLNNQNNYNGILYPYLDYFSDSLILISQSNWEDFSNTVSSPNIVYNINNITSKVTSNENGFLREFQNTSAEYIAGLDLDFDSVIEVIALDSNGVLSILNLEGLLKSGFPTEVTLKPPILVRNLIGDQDFEIVGKSMDSSSIYIISSHGEILYKINSLVDEKLICLETFDNLSSIVTEKRIIQFDQNSEPLNKGWSHVHGDSKRNRYLNIENENHLNNFEIINSYVYPNPIRDDLGKIRIETKNSNEIEIMIFDLAGYYIEKFHKKDIYPDGYQINEFTWNVSTIESGVYFAKIKVTESKNNKSNNSNLISLEKIIKIAVIH